MKNHLFDGLLSNANRQKTLAYLEDGSEQAYGALISLSGRLANVLVDIGVTANGRVVAQVPKSMETIALYLACLRVGAVFLPLNTAYTAHELEYFISDAGAAVFICSPTQEKALASIAAKNGAILETLGESGDGSLIEKCKTAPEHFATVHRAPSDLAAILYTSGTTGRSKGAMLTHDNLLSNAMSLVNLWQFTDRDILFHALPLFHLHGLFVATHVTLCAGGAMVFVPSFSVERALTHLPNCTAMMGVPTFYTRLLNEPRFTKDLVLHMRLFISGSAPLHKDTHIQFEQRTGQRILERYGMTETNMTASNPYDAHRKAGTVGFPLPGVQIRVCDPESGKELPQGKIGGLEVRGPNLFKGYWNMPEKTAEDHRDDGYFITGDLACIDSDGYLQIVGRSKDLIISGGYNIYPKEIEILLDEQSGVLESAVIGVPHPDFGEGVVGVLVASDKSLCTDRVAEDIRYKIARFKQPKELVVVSELPRNTMGKVQKNSLRQQFKNLFQKAI